LIPLTLQQKKSPHYALSALLYNLFTPVCQKAGPPLSRRAR
jgi:hypothetical protein